MLALQKFSGINNVQPGHRLTPEPKTGVTPLATATNVDVGLTGELTRRGGYSELLGTSHRNMHQAFGFLLATTGISGDLTSMNHDGSGRTTLYPSLGTSRVWYCNLPDGRTTFSNGTVNGVTDGATATRWGVPVPSGLGALTAIAGDLYPGDYQYQLTHVRLSDGLEGGPLYSNPIPVPEGGVFLSGLPVLAGHTTNVYLTGANGDTGFFAGSTTGSLFSYIGKNDALALPCRTEFLSPAPTGTVSAFWRGRALTAVGPVLYASKTNQWEAFDFRRDFKQFSGDITLIQPVDGGIFVGTTTELAFLSGTEFDKLAYVRKADGAVVLGSGVAVRGELLQQGEGAALGGAMICIANNVLLAGYSNGSVIRISEGRYATDVTEVSATFRMTGGIPQYVAVPQ